MASDLAIGIDFGASGIKAALVDCRRGRQIGGLKLVPTPRPSTPEAVMAATRDLVALFPAGLPVGLGVPAPVVDGCLMTAWHIDDSWIGFDFGKLAPPEWGLLTVINDADAAAIGEVRFGVARARNGVGLILTLGTGIGSAVIVDGVLVPNTEFGHVEVGDLDAGHFAAASVKSRLGLSWEEWAERLTGVLGAIDRLLWPDYTVLTGAVTREAASFLPHIRARMPLSAGLLTGWSGVAGAAVLAWDAEGGA